MHISRILHIKPFVSAKDGDQLVDFYWIDPMLVAECLAAKSKYAGNLKFELEDSWERPGTRAFGRVNGGLGFRLHISSTKTASHCSVFSTLINHF